MSKLEELEAVAEVAKDSFLSTLCCTFLVIVLAGVTVIAMFDALVYETTGECVACILPTFNQ